MKKMITIQSRPGPFNRILFRMWRDLLLLLSGPGPLGSSARIIVAPTGMQKLILDFGCEGRRMLRNELTDGRARRTEQIQASFQRRFVRHFALHCAGRPAQTNVAQNSLEFFCSASFGYNFLKPRWYGHNVCLHTHADTQWMDWFAGIKWHF